MDTKKLYQTANTPSYEELKALAREKRKNPTQAEEIFWEAVRNKQCGLAFRRQHIIDRFIVDFFCPEKNLIIEIDGAVHDEQQEYDLERQMVLEGMGFSVLRFRNDEVLQNIVAVREAVIGVEMAYECLGSKEMKES